MPLVPSYIKQLSNYKPGKPIDEVKRELGIDNIIKLASNENPLGPSPKAKQAMESILRKVHRYPDASGYELRNKLSVKFNVNINNVVLGAGSEGIMSTIMRTFLLNDDELISAENSFIGFKVLAKASGKKTKWVPMKDNRYDLNAMAKQINDYTKIIYIANPDNPMGTYITKNEFEEFYSYVPDRVLIILDEAYFEYACDKKDYPDSMYYRYNNVITLRSFSKAYGLGGVRIGYGFAHDDLISNLMKVKVPFEPSMIAQVAGYAALEDSNFLKKTIEINKAGSKYLKNELDTLRISYIPSATNFITIFLESENKAKKIVDRLMKNGVIVRHLDSFGWPNYIRISIGIEEENKRFISTLKKCYEQYKL
ncbi:MAG: histidinol-phosphate transaminase [Candidatus Marinimicrobia bacterium]|nr:histidinol-phosphate transaminase [Candidatus Neomarinimicrobiota bacterium]|tara:strand:+ start:741 stop:1841 length:1101 start_codon:yes stop_codon:yes gene_type:complete